MLHDELGLLWMIANASSSESGDDITDSLLQFLCLIPATLSLGLARNGTGHLSVETQAGSAPGRRGKLCDAMSFCST